LRLAYGIGLHGVAFHGSRVGHRQLGIELPQPRGSADRPIGGVLRFAAIETLRRGHGWQQARNHGAYQADAASSMPSRRDTTIRQWNTWAGNRHVSGSGNGGRVASQWLLGRSADRRNARWVGTHAYQPERCDKFNTPLAMFYRRLRMAGDTASPGTGVTVAVQS
jgi:hypothetical protein